MIGYQMVSLSYTSCRATAWRFVMPATPGAKSAPCAAVITSPWEKTCQSVLYIINCIRALTGYSYVIIC